MADQPRLRDVRQGDYRHWERGMELAGLDPALLLASAQNGTIRKAMIDAGNAAMEDQRVLALESGAFSTTLHHGMYISVAEQHRIMGCELLGGEWGGTMWTVRRLYPNHTTWHPDSKVASVLIPRRWSDGARFQKLLALLSAQRRPPVSRIEVLDRSLCDFGTFDLQRIDLEHRVCTVEDRELGIRSSLSAATGVLVALWLFPRWKTSLFRRTARACVRFWLLGYDVQGMQNHERVSVIIDRAGVTRVEVGSIDIVEDDDIEEYYPVILRT